MARVNSGVFHAVADGMAGFAHRCRSFVNAFENRRRGGSFLLGEHPRGFQSFSGAVKPLGEPFCGDAGRCAGRPDFLFLRHVAVGVLELLVGIRHGPSSCF